MYVRSMKRILDALLSFVALVLLSPLFGILALWVKLDSKGPAFFVQERVGKDKTTFLIYKFRSMKTDAPRDTPTHELGQANRYITRCGEVLRKYSLDELPQLINILKGDMSIVGPRPALPNQLDLIAERDRYGANGVRPGLTGPAQIGGRDELPIPEKAALDGSYVKRITFTGDLVCILKTVAAVIRHSGVVEGAKR
ncbi:MAG: sugar transferase [Candidatus Excrementavichristensenella sp.]|jgi:O-antigen biosynthesis protein WbqP